MLHPPLPADEPTRLATLHGLDVLDTPPDPVLDELTHVAGRICTSPIALLGLVDAHRTWFKSRVGLDATEAPRELAFCSHAILGHALFEIVDSHADPRFADNPLVTGPPHVRFYAGMPLVVDDAALGTLCVIDRVPRSLDADQREALHALAGAAASHLEARRTRRRLAAAQFDARRLAAAHAHPAARPGRAGHAAEPGVRRCDVLVVGDEPVNRLLAERLLHRAGHRVAVANDGIEALARTRDRRYDLILMDCSMPRLDGLRATRLLRDSDGPNRHTPVLALTANVRAAEHAACRQAGMDDVLTKPLRPGELAAAIARLARHDRSAT